MSVEKVEAYKAYKKDKKKILKREKRQRMLGIILGTAAAVVIVGWLGWSVYHKATTPAAGEQTASVTSVNMNSFDEYYSGLALTYSALDSQSAAS